MRDKVLLVVAFGVIVVAVLALSLVAITPTAYAKWGPPAKITWSSNPVTATIAPGATYSTTVTFTSTVQLNNVTLRLTPWLMNTTSVSPTTFATISAGVPYTVEIDVAIPANTCRQPHYVGVLTVRTDHHAYADPLQLRFAVTPCVPPAKITWSSNPVRATIARGATYSTTVAFTSTVQLNNVTLRLTPWLKNTTTVSPSTFATISAGVPYTVEIDVAIPANTFWREYDGVLTVRTGDRAYADPLQLRFKVQKRGPPAKITWSSNPVTATIAPGETYSTTVTFTSTAQINNVTLRLAPSLMNTTTVSPTTFATVSAGVPHTVEIDVAMPANPLQDEYDGVLTVYTGDYAYADPLQLSFAVLKIAR